jgi:tetratricopeptide (TPR) repeat protein
MGDDRALGAWDTIVREQPESCSAHIQLAKEALKHNDLARARELAAKAERLKPSAKNAYEIGWIYQHLERYDEALRFYFEAEKLNLGDKPLLYGAISSCYISLGQKDAAIEYVNRVLEIDPEDDFAKELLQTCEEMTERSSDD